MPAYRWVYAVFLLVCWPLSSVNAEDCVLPPLAEQMQQPTLRTNEPQQAEWAYRRQLLRFTNGFYSALSQDILRGEGEYLQALQHLMGSSGNHCLYTYKRLLLQESNSQDFALALWALRVVEEPRTRPVTDWGSLSTE